MSAGPSRQVEGAGQSKDAVFEEGRRQDPEKQAWTTTCGRIKSAAGRAAIVHAPDCFQMKNSLQRTSIPNPTPFLFVMAAILLWYRWSEDAGPLSGIAASVVMVVLLAGVVYIFAQIPMVAVISLAAAGTMARLYVEVFGLKVRPEHAVVGVCCLALPFWQRQHWARPRWFLPDLLLAFYMASNLLSSLVMSIAPAKTLRWAAQQILVILPYFILRVFCTDRERFRKAFMVLLAVGSAQAAIGVVCFFSNLIFGSEFGMEIGQYGSIPGTYGLNYEANILGSLSAASFVMILVMYLKERRPILLCGVAITYAAALIALSRAAIMAAFITVALLVVVDIKIKQLDLEGVRKVATAIVIVSLVLLPVVLPLYLERFSTLNVSDISADDNTAARLVTVVSAADGIMAHPIMGNGTSSFQLLVSYQELGFGDVEGGTWIGNTELRVLHDTGLVGLALLLSFFGSLLLRAWRILRHKLRPELLALLFACVVYAVAFQATEGTLLEFFWVHAGFVGCAVSLYHDDQVELPRSLASSGSLGGASA